MVRTVSWTAMGAITPSPVTLPSERWSGWSHKACKTALRRVFSSTVGSQNAVRSALVSWCKSRYR
ncbi:hypothetical protein BGW80DRAFT_1315475 [Lactifluus volemus]|nr:hypothetical protein BGW80DRAFT_1315475 [Lactifluus volemus]